MGREAQIIGHTVDIFNVEWDVREKRKANGFDVKIGWPTLENRGRGGRGVGIILTQKLAEYLLATRLKDVDLPISNTAVKRLRKKLGIRWSWETYWIDKKDDLLKMSLSKFCDKYDCSIGAASQRRAQAKKWK